MSGQENHQCQICGSRASIIPSGCEYPLWSCPSCGKYAFDSQASIVIDKPAMKPHLPAIASFLAARRVRGLDGVLITRTPKEIPAGLVESRTIEEIVADFPKDVVESLERSLLNLSYRFPKLGETFVVPQSEAPLIYGNGTDSVGAVVDTLREIGWLGAPLDNTFETSDLINVARLTVKGWETVRSLRAKSETASLGSDAFIAMAFSPATDPTYFHAIKPAVEDSGHKPIRIDQEPTNDKICDKIVAGIRRCRFTIADFTLQRGGVYFEAGLAMGLGKPVVWLVHDSDKKNLHFDTRQYSHIIYETVDDLRPRLLARILATIGEGPVMKSVPETIMERRQ